MTKSINGANHNDTHTEKTTSHPADAPLDNKTCHLKKLVVQDEEAPLHVLHSETVYREDGGADFAVTRVMMKNVKTGEQFPIHYASVKNGHTGAVCVAQLAGSERLLLARHWRTTTQNWAWEFPRGMGEADENAIQTAAREFLEETGMAAANDSNFVLQHIHADTGVLKDSIAVVSMTVEESENPLGINAVVQREHDWELSNMRWLSASDITAMIAQGAIDDAITLASYAIWQAHRRLSRIAADSIAD